MTDILKGLSSGRSFLVSWIFPSALMWSLLTFLLLQGIPGAPLIPEVFDGGVIDQSFFLVALTLVTSILLSSLSSILYRILEGYYLMPASMSSAWCERQRKKQEALHVKLEKLRDQRRSTSEPVAGSQNQTAATVGIDVKIGLINEQLCKYPSDHRQYGPTAFANAFRAIETYGWDRYRLDSQTLWSEIQGTIPETLLEEQEQSRAPVNFFVSLIYLSPLTGALLLSLWFHHGLHGATLPIVSAALLGSMPAWYRLAVLNTRYLQAVMQASVNLSRPNLCSAMGLKMPDTLEAEREMWELVFWFINAPFDEKYSKELDKYRASQKETKPTDGGNFT